MLVSVKVTVVPLTFTLVTVFATLFITTAKSSAVGVPATASLMVNVTVFVPTAAACAVIVGTKVSMPMTGVVPAPPVLPAVSV